MIQIPSIVNTFVVVKIGKQANNLHIDVIS